MTLHMTCLFCMCRVIHHFLFIYYFPFDGDFDKAGAGRPAAAECRAAEGRHLCRDRRHQAAEKAGRQ